jgi:hypothetical protein
MVFWLPKPCTYIWMERAGPSHLKIPFGTTSGEEALENARGSVVCELESQFCRACRGGGGADLDFCI